MINILKELVGKLGVIFLPITLLVLNPNPPTGKIQMVVTPTPTITATPTLTPTETPTPSPTPKPTSVPKPSPTPLPTAVPFTGEQFENWFNNYCNNFNIEKEKLRSIAYCESKFNPNAINGDYCGLFQFSSDTWQSTRREMGLDENPDLRFNPEEAIKTAAFKISRGGINSWRNCLK